MIPLHPERCPKNRYDRRRVSVVARVLLLLVLSSCLSSADFAGEVKKTMISGGRITPAEDAAGAVDGKVDGSYDFHTNRDNPPWWQVDLGTVESIARIAIHTPHVPERLSRFHLLVSDDARTWRTVHTHAALSRKDVKVDVRLEDVRGRHLRIAAFSSTWLHLEEVMVFDSQDAGTNLALGRPCMQSSVSEWSSRSVALSAKEDWRTSFDTARRVIDPVLARIGGAEALVKRKDALIAGGVPLDDPRWETLYREALAEAAKWTDVRQQFALVNVDALKRALDALSQKHPKLYADAETLRQHVDGYARSFEDLKAATRSGRPGAWKDAARLIALQRDILLRNPVLDFERMITLRRNLGSLARRAVGRSLGTGTLNSHTNDSLRRDGWDNQVAVLTGWRTRPELTILLDGEGRIVKDLEVDFDASRMMFSSIGRIQKNWRVFEMDLGKGAGGGGNVRQFTPDDGEDVGHFDSCYLGDPDQIIFCSTAAYQGLPCEYGHKRMTCLFRLDRPSGRIRQLTFEQDSDWSPTSLPNGRVMYERWEYCDLPHSNSRILFQMNPDGTAQMEYYGSGSYFMPSYFFARPIPGRFPQVVGIATGHHGTPRSGRLLVVDPSRGRREAEGVVREIPGWGKTVLPEVRDRLADFDWPHFLHPYPLDETTFIVAMKPTPDALWGIYLADAYDNLTLIYQEEDCAILDPIPLVVRPRPPALPDRTTPGATAATVFLADIYQGAGLAGVPRGTIKRLRVGTYYFGTHGMGGLLGSLGADGPWDIKRVFGTTPVEADGSAFFTIPANTPIFLQPLDDEGKAVQLMRSWMVGMPGETVSCVGCHEDQSSVVLPKTTLSSQRQPTPITPENGPVRGFSFAHRIQPILDRYCVGCHNASAPAELPAIPGIVYPEDLSRDQDNGEGLVDLRGGQTITDWRSGHGGNCGGGARGGNFPISYVALERYVRRNGIEGPLHTLSPGEFHADTTELVQMLRDGRHYNVRLDLFSWQTLVTWIDLNAPCHGTWAAVGKQPAAQVARVNARRMELAQLYAGISTDYEEQDPLPPPTTFQGPQAVPIPEYHPAKVSGWPFSPETASAMQGTSAVMSIDLGEGIAIAVVRVPAGRFVTAGGQVRQIERPFWLARYETTNEQMRRFDPTFNSRREDRYGYQFGRLCYGMNGDEMAAVRVDWNKAAAFCRWLSEHTGRRIVLPTEEQWEWACRAGSASDFWFGKLGVNFAPYANLGDVRLQEFAANTTAGGYTTTALIRNPGKYDDRIPRDRQIDDTVFLTHRFPRNEKGVMLALPMYQAERPDGCVGMPQAQAFKPNPWGLYDMHGNVWEWTSSETVDSRKLACGGSFYGRPKRCTAASRLDYRPYHRVFNVGFRIAVLDD
jgi:formylglycine-generating enzyme required for sulfatase activity